MTEREQTIRRIADAHFRCEPGMQRIFRIRDEADESQGPVILLEVNENTIPSGILPLGFGSYPEGGIGFPSVIIEVTPEEFDEIASGQLPLPNGWEIGEEIPRSSIESSV